MLKKLTEEEYARRAAHADRVAVFREFLADRETPVAALSRLDDEEEAFLLESVAGGETRGRYSYLGLEPSDTSPTTPSGCSSLGWRWSARRERR